MANQDLETKYYLYGQQAFRFRRGLINLDEMVKACDNIEASMGIQQGTRVYHKTKTPEVQGTIVTADRELTVIWDGSLPLKDRTSNYGRCEWGILIDALADRLEVTS